MSFFSQNMESGVQGDLVDVIRGGGGGGGGGFLRATNEFEVLGEKVSANTVDAALLSTPRGSKRRKGLAKRVICIPAPAADQESNNKSNTSGSVVVPSDLWAWRKYGQKPIKGSPYPRGYYRCSSSKGCSARKQVERSRNDPNMLVITYTSDHNHPWPTHRNSLAGSTRSKNYNNAATATTTAANKNQTSPSTSKQEVPLHDDDHDTTMPLSSSMIKEENIEFDRNVFDKSYEPMMFESKDMEFFEGLGGLDPNPMSFFFSSSREFKFDEVGGSDNNSKGLSLDPLSYFDTWDDI